MINFLLIVMNREIKSSQKMKAAAKLKGGDKPILS